MNPIGVADLPDRVHQRILEDPDCPLVLGLDRQATRQCVWDLAASLADKLASAAVDSHQVITVAVPDGAGFLAALVAVWRRSCVALLMDSDTPPNTQREVASTLGAAALLTCGHPWPESADDFQIEPIQPAATRRLPGAAVIKLTSGTSGAARGIQVSAQALRADTEVLEDTMGIGAADRVLAGVPMSFSYGLGSIAMPALLHGRQLILADSDRPLSRLTAALHHGATVLPTVPVFVQAMLRRESLRLPDTLRLVISAGAPLEPEVARRFRERFGLGIHAFYGASECGGITYDQTGTAAERGSVGTPLPGVDARVDPDTRLLQVRSPAVATGYLPDTDDALAGGSYQTLDQAHWRDEELVLVGRKGSLINVGGHNVDPRRIEMVIGELPGVAEVLVIPIEGRVGGSVTCCAVVASPDQSVTRKEVLAQCQNGLARYERPRQILVVSNLPRTMRGKLSTQTIRALIADNT